MQAVTNSKDEVVIETQAVTEKDSDNLHFKCQLFPDHIETLAVIRSLTGYKWAIEISNGTINYKKETYITLYVRLQGVM